MDRRWRVKERGGEGGDLDGEDEREVEKKLHSRWRGKERGEEGGDLGRERWRELRRERW